MQKKKNILIVMYEYVHFLINNFLIFYIPSPAIYLQMILRINKNV